MNAPSRNDTDREERLDEAVACYLRAAQNGQPPARDEFLAAYPDLTPELEAFLADEQRFEHVAAPLQAATRTDPALPQGTIVGDHELLDVIAQGGMGVVYRARQISLHRIVA